MNNLFGIGILLELRDQVSNRLRGVSSALEETETQAEQTARSFNDLQDVLRDDSGFQLSSSESEALGRVMNGTSREAEKFQRRMQRLSGILGGEMPESTRKAYATMQMLNMEMRRTRRAYGSYSAEAMEARNRMTEFALAMDDNSFKQIYMRSQLGLTDRQLQMQANSIKLNARMTRLMGNQTEILTRRMEGLQRHGIKPEMMLPPSTLGQFQMMNETMALGISPLNRLSAGYRGLGQRVEGVIKNYSAQKIAVREAQGDMVRYGLIMRSLQAGLMNFNMAFLAVGMGALFFYKGIFSVAMQQKKSLQDLADVTKNKVLKAMEPLINAAAKFLEIGMKVVGVVADWISKFNEAHPVIAKVLGVIGFLAPAMTLLLLPLGLGIGLWKGWMFVLNGVWTLIGGVVTLIGTASATFLALAGVIGAVVVAFTHLWKTNESFRNAVTSIWEGLKATAINVFGAIKDAVTRLANAFKEGGIIAVFQEMDTMFQNMISKLHQNFPKLVESGVQAVTNFIQGFTQKLPEIAEKGSEMLGQLLNGIVKYAPKLVQCAVDLIQVWVNSWTTNISLILNAGVMLITTLTQGIVQALPQLMDCIIQIVQTFIQILTENAPMIVESAITIVKALVDGIVQALPALVEGVILLMQTLVQFITENLPIIMDSAIYIITALLEGIIQNLPMLLDAGMQLIMALVQGIIQNLPMIIDCFVQLIGLILTTLLSLLPQLIMMGINLITSLISGMLSMAGALLGAMVNLVGQLIISLVSALPRFLAQGVQIVGQIAGGILQAIGKAISAMGNVMSKAEAEARKGISKFLSIGKSIIEGLASGIANGVSSVINAVGNVVGKAIDKGKSMLKINSPSKVFRSMGYSINEGMVQGIDRSAEDVVNSVGNMAEDTIDTAQALTTNKNIMVDLGNPRQPKPQQAVPIKNDYHYEINVTTQSGDDPTTMAQKIYQEIKRLQQLDTTMGYSNNLDPVF